MIFKVECVICFENIKKEDIVDCNYCDTNICKDCLDEYINILKVDKKNVSCPNCKKDYSISNLPNKDDELKLKFGKQLMKNIIHNDTSFNKNYNINMKLENIRKNRKVFLKEKFPKAIYFTCELVMKNKLNKINKNIKNKVNKDLQNTYKKCFNFFCEGLLDKNNKCVLCGSSFCRECEKELSDNHECNENDIYMVDYISKTKKCPECFVPIFKTYGCDNMTCVNCGKKFKYSTCEIGGSGSEQDRHISIKHNEKKISIIYKNYIQDNELFSLLLDFEDKKNKMPSTNNLQILINKYFNNDITNEDIINFCTKFDRYILKIEKRKKYMKKINEIEKLILEKKLTKEKLIKIIDIF